MRNLPSIRTTCHKGIDENTDNVSLATCQDARNVWAPDGKVVQRPGYVGLGVFPGRYSVGPLDQGDHAVEDVSGGTVTVDVAVWLNNLVARQSGVAGDRWYLGLDGLTPTSGYFQAGIYAKAAFGTSTSISAKPEYWNGTSWQYLLASEVVYSAVSANSFSFTESPGHLQVADLTGIYWYFAVPGDWSLSTVTDTGTSTDYERYWIRFTLLEGASDTAMDATVKVQDVRMALGAPGGLRGIFPLQFSSERKYFAVSQNTASRVTVYFSPTPFVSGDSYFWYYDKGDGPLASAGVIPGYSEAFVAYNGLIFRVTPGEDGTRDLPAQVEDRPLYVGSGAPFDKDVIVQLGAFPAAKFILYHEGRLWAAGLEGQQSVVRWTGKVPYHKVWPALSWEPVEQDDNSPISALFAHGDQTCVSKHNSIWLMRDKGLNALDLREYDAQAIVRGVGVVANGSAKYIRGRSIFLAKDGVYAFDGTPAIAKLSDRIQGYVNRITPEARYRAVAVDWRSRNMYLLGVALDGSTTNNYTLVWDYKDDAWWIWDIPAGCWIEEKERLLFADGNGIVYELGPGRTDNGTAIDAWVETHELGANDNEVKRARCVRIAGSNGQATTTCELRPNGSLLRGVTATIDFSDYNETDRVLGKRMRRPRFKSTGDFFTVKVRNNQKADVFEMSNLALEYQRLGER